MASLTIVRILFCGQGMTTLVEVYADGVEKPYADYLALVDCGGESSWGKGAVDYITGKVESSGSVINNVVISHQDKDHVALLKPLGERLKAIDAEVNSIFVGGTNWEQSNKDTVLDFAKAVGYPTKGITFNAPEQSDYTDVTKRTNLGYLVKYGDVYLRVLVSGLVVTGRSDIKKNASSAVVVVENRNFSVVLPGDATFQTMDEINNIAGLTQNLLPKVIGLEIPHHGALRTAVENYVANKKTSHFDWSIVTTFGELLAPTHAAASAGPWNTHKHPLLEVLRVFEKKLVSATKHTFAAYLFDKPSDGSSERWRTIDSLVEMRSTVRAIGTTVSKPVPPDKQGVYKGKSTQVKPGTPFVYGDLLFKIAATGVLRPEEMVEFRPRGTYGMHGAADVVLTAPAPARG